MKTLILGLIFLHGATLLSQEINMFNGRDLTGWAGLPGYWSVRDGTITGRITEKNAIGGNTFLVWQGGEVSDFEMSFQYKLLAENSSNFTNSGVQFRATLVEPAKFTMQGYQAELDNGIMRPSAWTDMPNVNGSLTDDPPGILLCATGDKVVIHSGESAGNKMLGRFDVVGTLGTRETSAATYKAKDWNKCRLIALGSRIKIFVNGVQTADAIDEGNRYRSGLLGLQLHSAGKQARPKTIQFKDLKLRILSGAEPASTGDILPSRSAANATTHKPDEPQIRILSDESVNVTGWITSPLDVAVPEQIWENLNFLKEALKDEAAQKPAANPASYQLAVRLCLKMLENLAERDTATTRAGGNAVLHQKSNLTQQNRDHLTWPQYALERDERAERKENARNADKFMNGHYAVEWNNKTTNMRKEMQAMYSQFREALRQSAAK